LDSAVVAAVVLSVLDANAGIANATNAAVTTTPFPTAGAKENR
jgi:hypothetical protein